MEEILKQRKCEKCPALLPFNAGLNRRFCFDCLSLRKRVYALAYSKRSRDPQAYAFIQGVKFEKQLYSKVRMKTKSEYIEAYKKFRQEEKLYNEKRMADILEQRLQGKMSLVELGKKWGISRERARQIEKVGRQKTGNFEPFIKVCLYDGKPIETRHFNKKFCNAECAYEYFKKIYPHSEKGAAWRKQNAENAKLKRAARHKIWQKCANPVCSNIFFKYEGTTGRGGKPRIYCGSSKGKTGCSYLNQIHSNRKIDSRFLDKPLRRRNGIKAIIQELVKEKQIV